MADIELLAEAIWNAEGTLLPGEVDKRVWTTADREEYIGIAERTVASGWLAEHDREVRAAMGRDLLAADPVNATKAVLIEQYRKMDDLTWFQMAMLGVKAAVDTVRASDDAGDSRG